MTFAESLARLRQNWDKGLTEQIKRVWIAELEAGGWTEGQVESAVTKCIRDPEQRFCPLGFSEFARYLPPRSSADSPGVWQRGWWHQDGTWGGDWSQAAPEHLREVLVEMERNHEPCRNGTRGIRPCRHDGMHCATYRLAAFRQMAGVQPQGGLETA